MFVELMAYALILFGYFVIITYALFENPKVGFVGFLGGLGIAIYAYLNGVQSLIYLGIAMAIISLAPLIPKAMSEELVQV